LRLSKQSTGVAVVVEWDMPCVSLYRFNYGSHLVSSEVVWGQMPDLCVLDVYPCKAWDKRADRQSYQITLRGKACYRLALRPPVGPMHVPKLTL